jgi:hypothetical protein
MNIPSHYLSVFFVLGLLVVAGYAWQRFNEPSFPNHEALPRTVEPLRYLFLKRAYRRARFTYIAISLLLYSVLVWPGPTIVPALGIVGVKDFPAEGWALLVALLLVGLIPNSNVKWLTTIEERLRRGVHAWFLVPDRVVKTIGLLEDARYEPPLSQINAVPSSQREMLQRDLKAPSNSLEYRWARATMLIASLNQMGAGAVHPLNRAAFDPFREDFEGIREKYRALAQEVGDVLQSDERNFDAEENLTRAVDNLLKRIYAYISWGLRQQAETERDVDSTLAELGFSIPVVGDRRLFDIVMPAVVLVAVITMGFWLLVDLISSAGGGGLTLAQSVVGAVSSAMAASLMYGGAVYIALSRRAAKIERKEWTQGSPRCLVSIAISAGLLTWLLIVVTTALWEVPQTMQSLSGLAHLLKSVAAGGAVGEAETSTWSFLPIKIVTAAPWLLAGATVSVLVAKLIGGKVISDQAKRRHDALVLGAGLGMAAAAAQLIQVSLMAVLLGQSPSFGFVPLVGLAGFACGAAIGFVVPHALRKSLIEPFDLDMAHALSELLRRVEGVMGTQAAAEGWALTPHRQLRGITPAEAIQYKGYASTVRGLLDQAVARSGQEPASDRNRALPHVIEGGRKLG